MSCNLRAVSPAAALLLTKLLETKKTWENILRAYPCSQAFALPPDKDKQRKPAHAD